MTTTHKRDISTHTTSHGVKSVQTGKSDNINILLAASKCVEFSEPGATSVQNRMKGESTTKDKSKFLNRSTTSGSSCASESDNDSSQQVDGELVHGDVKDHISNRKRRIQQSMAQSRYRSRQKTMHSNLEHELDVLKNLAKKYDIKVDSQDDIAIPDINDISNEEIEALYSSSNSKPVSSQALAQRKYRAKLKVRRTRIQQQLNVYRELLFPLTGNNPPENEVAKAPVDDKNGLACDLKKAA